MNNKIVHVLSGRIERKRLHKKIMKFKLLDSNLYNEGFMLEKIRKIGISRKLHEAVTFFNTDELNHILQIHTGFDINSRDPNNENRTALHKAASHCYLDAIVKLLNFGANPNLLDAQGNSPLYLAVSAITHWKSDIECIVQTLINNGADIFIKNKFGQTVVDCARKYYNNCQQSRKQLICLNSDEEHIFQSISNVMDILDSITSMTLIEFKSLRISCPNDEITHVPDPVNDLSSSINELSICLHSVD